MSGVGGGGGGVSGVTTAASTNVPSAAAAPSSSAAALKCLNPECAELKSRKGWRLRSGEYADLCDRCASAYEEGTFCETFHLNACGWRSCESCGKRVHCGCIVSIHSFLLLDAGGIECMTCARKKLPVTSNPAWSPPVFYHTPLTERLKDPSGKSWNQLAGSGPVTWRQAASQLNSSISPEINLRMLYQVDRINAIERLSAHSLEKGKIEDTSERLMNGRLNLGAWDILENGIAGTNSVEQSGLCLNMTRQSSSLRDDPSSPHFGMGVLSPNDANKIGASGSPLRSTPLPFITKQFHGNLHNGVDSLADCQIRNVRHRADARGKSQLLPRYCPRFTDEELQQITGNSNSVITPLFEKMLSASDAGRIGRLVLPKKCAEAYFPPISQPEGLPLKVQDAKGKEWIFQFRFWPNNNSRMYVLEGVTPCIQSMQLQAGDIVTFSRLEPQGKLVMGYRKASVPPPGDQDSETNKTRNAASTDGDVELAEPGHWSKLDKSGYIAKDVESKSPMKKRKSSTLGSKSKRLRIDSDDMMELKLTWEEAQGLLRPPPDHVPSIVVIEGFKFEEYEDPPVLGRPTFFTTDCEGSLCSAAQELTADQLEDLLPSYTTTVAASKKLKAPKMKVDNLDSLEGLDTLANLAILGEGETFAASAHATTKHPRHRPGCSCIVCIQPPSGKGPKHKQTCTCNVCQTVKRRFKTLMMKRDKKKSEKEAEASQKKAQEHSPEKLLDDEPLPCNAGNSTPKKMATVIECSDDLSKSKSSTSPFKGQIDLNMQPEREEELSPGSESGSTMKMLQDTTERYQRQHKFPNSDGNDNSTRNQTLLGDIVTGETVGIGFTFSSSHNDAGDGHPTAFSLTSSSSAPEAG